MSDDDSAHVMPCGDVIDHLTGPDCLCGPSSELVKRKDGSDGWLYVHHSLDGRENTE
jgi:hypothetical protein